MTSRSNEPGASRPGRKDPAGPDHGAGVPLDEAKAPGDFAGKGARFDGSFTIRQWEDFGQVLDALRKVAETGNPGHISISVERGIDPEERADIKRFARYLKGRSIGDKIHALESRLEEVGTENRNLNGPPEVNWRRLSLRGIMPEEVMFRGERAPRFGEVYWAVEQLMVQNLDESPTVKIYDNPDPANRLESIIKEHVIPLVRDRHPGTQWLSVEFDARQSWERQVW